MDIEELFREKLENAEFLPGEALNADLMRKLGRQEFIRFIPGKFNIYYLGLIVAAAITAGILLFSGDDIPDIQPEPATSLIVPEARIIPSVPAIRAEEDIKVSEKILNTEAAGVSIETEHKDVQVSLKEEGPQLAEAVSGILPTSGLFNKHGPATEKLQSKSTGSDALFVPSVGSGCAPLKVHFTNKAVSYSNFSWTFGDGGYSDKQEPEWIFDEEGEFTVVMIASDGSGKKNSWTTLIKVFPKPKAHFEISPENAILPIDEVRFSNYSTGASSYDWDFGDGNTSSDFEPTHKYLKYGNYDISLVVTSEYGCSDKLVIEDAFSGSEFFIEMPNAFIPNPHGQSGGIYSSKSDESAEIFHPTSSGVTEYKMSIFSKVGILIFESTDINIGWDGYFKGQLCNPGVYIWKIRGNYSNGEPFTKMGDVTLLRN